MATGITRILKRDGTEAHFDKEKIRVAVYKAGAAQGVHDRDMSELVASDVARMLLESYTDDLPPTVEGIQDLVEKVLVARGYGEIARAYTVYRAKRAAIRERRSGTRRRVPEPIPYKILWQSYVWAVDLGVGSVEGLNEKVRSGGFPDLVRASGDFYDRQVAEAAREIIENRSQVRMVIIAGPSSSGKTTTTNKLGEHLARHGLKLKALNVDNYFFDLELHPKDEHGDFDFETPEALDLKLINQHLNALLDGDEVMTPFYNFKTGRREGLGTRFRLARDEILLIDCLHGLYDEMTGSIPPEAKYRLYIETLAQLKGPDNRFIRFYDVRLLRRMIRDTLHRSYDPRKTLLHWHYVRRSELKHIIPFIHDVDYVINSYQAYELPVMKNLLFHHFPGYLRDFRDDPARQDAYVRASRVHELLHSLDEVSDHSCIGGKALLREFIGGSEYKY